MSVRSLARVAVSVCRGRRLVVKIGKVSGARQTGSARWWSWVAGAASALSGACPREHLEWEYERLGWGRQLREMTSVGDLECT